MPKQLVIFASGSGSNAENIIRYFQKKQTARVAAVLSNRKNAFVLDRAKKLGVPARAFSKDDLYSNDTIKNLLLKINPDLIVLAGFLLKFPEDILKEFPSRVINIHPALLPKYGGKGMYGSFVHQAVLENKEKETGISIHYVNEEYDEGALIFQKSFAVDPEETPDSLVEKIHALEHEWFPQVIESILSSKKPETADGQKE